MPKLEVKITTEEVSAAGIYAASGKKPGSWKSASHDDSLASVSTCNSGEVTLHRTLRSAGRIQARPWMRRWDLS